jgi:DNA-binding GntR family transcriptional regulator
VNHWSGNRTASDPPLFRDHFGERERPAGRRPQAPLEARPDCCGACREAIWFAAGSPLLPGGPPPAPGSAHPRFKESIARYLEENIIEGKMEAGTRLVPEEIAESLKVSKSPVREALLNLQKEGLVNNVPRVGFFVADISMEDIDEIYPIRAALISLTIKMIIEKEYEPNFIKTLESFLAKMQTCVKQEDLEGYYHLNVQLYNYYSEACPNCRLNAMTHQLGKQVLRFRRLGMTPPGRIQRSLELNQALVKAIRERNAVEATPIVERIISEGLISLRALLSTEGSK